MKRRDWLTVTAGLFGLSFLNRAQGASATQTTSEVLERLTTVKTARRFSPAAVSEADLETMLRAGLNAPSAHNRQPWHFTVVTDHALLEEIDVAAGKPKERLSLAGTPTAIIVSCDDSSSYALFDLGTAADRIGVAALALGYGVKYVGTPAAKINEKYRERLEIPEKFHAFAVLLIGEETVDADALSGATTRESLAEKVNFVRP